MAIKKKIGDKNSKTVYEVWLNGFDVLMSGFCRCIRKDQRSSIANFERAFLINVNLASGVKYEPTI